MLRHTQTLKPNKLHAVWCYITDRHHPTKHTVLSLKVFETLGIVSNKGEYAHLNEGVFQWFRLISRKICEKFPLFRKFMQANAVNHQVKALDPVQLFNYFTRISIFVTFIMRQMLLSNISAEVSEGVKFKNKWLFFHELAQNTFQNILRFSRHIGTSRSFALNQAS